MRKLPGDLTSTLTYENGSTATIVDAWFVHDNVNTYYAGDYTLDVRALFLPTLRGFGQLADLHIAMSSDATLVEDLAADWDFSRFPIRTTKTFLPAGSHHKRYVSRCSESTIECGKRPFNGSIASYPV